MMVQGQVSEEPVVGVGRKRKKTRMDNNNLLRVYIHLAKPTETGPSAAFEGGIGERVSVEEPGRRQEV